MRDESEKTRLGTRDKMPPQKAPSTGSFITSTRTRRTVPAASETMKLERETQDKMRKLTELRSNVAAERQVTEELRREVSTKGCWNFSQMPSGHDKAAKPTRDPINALLQQPPPSNFKIKRSSTFKSSPDTHLKENKVAKYDRAQPLKSGGATPDLDQEEVHCKSAVEALQEWHDSGCITPSDSQQTRANPQQQFQAHHVPSRYWDEGLGQPMNVDNMDVDMDTPPVEVVQPSRTWCTMDTQTERPRQAEIELDPPTTLQGTYFQHLCNQGRKVRA